MTAMLLTLALTAPSADPIPPALVPPIAVAGAAVVLGTDVIALKRSPSLANFDKGVMREAQTNNPLVGNWRREQSVAQAAVARNPLTREERDQLIRDTQEKVRRMRGLRESYILQRVASEQVEMFHSLSLIVPASHVHPAIRQDLGRP